MNLDPQYLQKVLEYGAKALPEYPKWVGLSDVKGNLICSIGEMYYVGLENVTSESATQQVHLLTEQNYTSLEKIAHGNFQMSVHLGGQGSLFILNMNDVFRLAVSYHGFGFPEGGYFTSTDATCDAIVTYSQIIMDAIFLNNFKPEPIQETSTIDNASLTKTLSFFMKELPDNPQWVMIIDETGKVLAFEGEILADSQDNQPITKEEFAQIFSEHIKNMQLGIGNLSANIRNNPSSKKDYLLGRYDGLLATAIGDIIFTKLLLGTLVINYNYKSGGSKIIRQLPSILLSMIDKYRPKFNQLIRK